MTITIKGNEYNVKYTIRSMFIFEKITKKQFKIESIMDEDFRLISAEALDSASQEIADDYNFLLNV